VTTQLSDAGQIHDLLPGQKFPLEDGPSVAKHAQTQRNKPLGPRGKQTPLLFSRELV
tara:strand:- start:77 stop:247 length:171 start_codon:yes stop_codon:yes gene_type:complete